MSLEEKLASLREKFRETFKDELKTLIELWQQARTDQSADALKQFHFNVHSLKGSSGALNLLKLSQLMSYIELLIKPCLEAAQVSIQEINQVDQYMNMLIASSKSAHNSYLEQADKPGAEMHKDIHLPTDLVPPVAHLNYEDIHIALVDDDRAVGEMMKRLLSGFSFNVTYYSSLHDFQADLAQQTFHLVLLDLVMPGCSEEDVISCVNHLQSIGISTFILSSTGSFEARLKAVRANVCDYLLKPISITHLVTKIRKTLKLDLVRPFRVLLLDDQESVSFYYKNILEKQGCQVLAINDSHKLLEVLDSFIPDIFLLDMYMPDVSGLEVAKILRHQAKYDYVPILFLTSDNHIKTKLDALRAGADDVITKETSAELIISQVFSRVSRGQEMRYMASRDSLTGALNHGQIMDAAAHALRLTSRSDKPLILAMIDLDEFKQVNDRFGHGGGDKVLMGLGQLLLQSVRQTDYVGRYGGEEFMILFPDGEIEAVEKKLNTMREAFSKLLFNVDNQSFHVTLSAGMASSANHSTLSELIAAADSALYHAKYGGRNQVCCEQPD